jgi:ABC-type transporter Mla subunit MlaD
MRSIIGELITKDMVESVQRTITNIGDFAGAATPVASNLAKILEPRSVADVAAEGSSLKPNIATVVERLDRLVENVNNVLGDVNVQEDVKGAVRDLKTAVSDLRQTAEVWRVESKKVADNLNEGIDQTEASLSQSLRKVNEVLDDLDAGAKDLASIFRAIDQGEGTAGRFVRDERLYESGVLTLQRLTESMATLNRILGKVEDDGYFTISLGNSGLLKKEIPIPAAAAGKP